MEDKKKIVSSPLKEERKNPSRREFLKKAAWSAPGIIALGQLIKPVRTHADSKVPPPPDFW